jgi:hypothetical protein
VWRLACSAFDPLIAGPFTCGKPGAVAINYGIASA